MKFLGLQDVRRRKVVRATINDMTAGAPVRDGRVALDEGGRLRLRGVRPKN